MKEILLRELFRNTAEYQDKEVLIKGWVRNNRNSNEDKQNHGKFAQTRYFVIMSNYISRKNKKGTKCKNIIAYICSVFKKYCKTPKQKHLN